jgi:hypothetical protein
VLKRAFTGSQLVTCVEKPQGGGAEDVGRSFHPAREHADERRKTIDDRMKRRMQFFA